MSSPVRPPSRSERVSNEDDALGAMHGEHRMRQVLLAGALQRPISAATKAAMIVSAPRAITRELHEVTLPSLKDRTIQVSGGGAFRPFLSPVPRSARGGLSDRRLETSVTPSSGAQAGHEPLPLGALPAARGPVSRSRGRHLGSTSGSPRRHPGREPPRVGTTPRRSR